VVRRLGAIRIGDLISVTTKERSTRTSADLSTPRAPNGTSASAVGWL
jgi:hypothetical protein